MYLKYTLSILQLYFRSILTKKSWLLFSIHFFTVDHSMDIALLSVGDRVTLRTTKSPGILDIH